MNAREKHRLLGEAENYFRAGNQGLAKIILENIVATDPSSSKAYELLGYIHGNEGNLPLAHRCLETACRLPRHSPEVLYYLGVSYLKQKQPQSAIDAFTRSIALGGAFFEALHELGTAHSLAGNRQAALQAYLKAERLRPDSFDLVFNIGKVYDEIKDFGKAVAYYDRALRIEPAAADAWAHRGAVLFDSKRYADAIADWERALSIDPSIEFLFGFLVHARLRLCDWSRWHGERAELLRRVEAGDCACGPFEMLAICGDERIQLQSAQRWIAANFAGGAEAAGVDEPARQKIRIAYYSADFGRHAVSLLTAELFERHDRGDFELFGFAFENAAKDDPVRARLVRAFDRFIDVQGKSDAEIVALSRKLGVDIAVDLGGHTKHSRTGVFRSRAAPVQVNFLGYPGTMGAEFIDYMIADETVVPASSVTCYTERIVYLPDCFQPSDTTRAAPESNRSRRDFGLPEQGFVFCCFNNSYKLTPEVFESWMRILARVDGSCLWLLAEVGEIETNLRNEARRRGVDPDRLMFGGRVPLAEYFARYRCADLFLDTLPFNAGTTASDALWADLPVLTRRGGSFAGRMASSLLGALDLPELIVQTTDEYESRAVELARRPDELGRIRQKLAVNRARGPLFDMPRYTRHLEAAYREMHRRRWAGLPPDHIHVARGCGPTAAA